MTSLRPLHVLILVFVSKEKHSKTAKIFYQDGNIGNSVLKDVRPILIAIFGQCPGTANTVTVKIGVLCQLFKNGDNYDRPTNQPQVIFYTGKRNCQWREPTPPETVCSQWYHVDISFMFLAYHFLPKVAKIVRNSHN